ncbi:2,5-dioxopentanoate dehydrogenase [Phycisphaerales bacterium]|nr:2,5-dioxopentanoate dehydrogenase [Phycisphaerales bacterium]
MQETAFNVVFQGLNPTTGMPTRAYSAASSEDVSEAAERACRAFRRHPEATVRADCLSTAAAKLDAHADEILTVAMEETGLAEPRLRAELSRTTGTLRLFAALILEGSWVEAVIDHGDPSRKPLPRPDLRRMLVPLGPVAVFGASNFPLAYAVAGGDTASALAAGCPVIVKGHSAHPGTGELVAGLIAKAVREAKMPEGFFAFLPAGGSRDVEVGVEIVKHARVRAVGFTGSVPGGTALVRIAGERPEPIPVFAEMGSVNPVFVLPGAIEKDAAEVAAGLVASATNSGGQMCTCPGLIFVMNSPQAERMITAMREAFGQAARPTLLGPRTRDNYFRRLREIGRTPGVCLAIGSLDTPQDARISAIPTMLEVSYQDFKSAENLSDECFGPETIVVRCGILDDLIEAARAMRGSLTATLLASDSDSPAARRLLPELQDRAGRLIVNGVPTGVEVAAAMVHSGPFPACSRADTTAVGPLAIRRWCRPVCFQNVPDSLLPEELREANRLGISRVVDGARIEARAAR